jgi:hypothetical protein
MTTHEPLSLDLAALSEHTRRDLPSLSDTAAALAEQAARHRERRVRSRRLLVASGSLAFFILLLAAPVPRTDVVGYDLVLRRPDGKVTIVHLPRGTASQAQRRAASLRVRGTEVDVGARRERVWGSVFAMAREKVFRIDVDAESRSDAEVEEMIAAQLRAAGWTPSAVQVSRAGAGATVQLRADDGTGHHLEVTRRSQDGHVEIESLDIDDAPEPGMTDEQLRDKIAAQLRDRGLDAEVTVRDGRVLIRSRTSAPGR